jgi:hypothetical protein
VGGPTKGKSGAPEEEGALRTSAVPRMASVVAEQGPVATDQVEGRASERDPRLPLSVMNRAGVMSGGTTTAAKKGPSCSEWWRGR